MISMLVIANPDIPACTIDHSFGTTPSTPNWPINLFGDCGDSGKARSINTK